MSENSSRCNDRDLLKADRLFVRLSRVEMMNAVLTVAKTVCRNIVECLHSTVHRWRCWYRYYGWLGGGEHSVSVAVVLIADAKVYAHSAKTPEL